MREVVGKAVARGSEWRAERGGKRGGEAGIGDGKRGWCVREE